MTNVGGTSFALIMTYTCDLMPKSKCFVDPGLITGLKLEKLAACSSKLTALANLFLIAKALQFGRF